MDTWLQSHLTLPELNCLSLSGCRLSPVRVRLLLSLLTSQRQGASFWCSALCARCEVLWVSEIKLPAEAGGLKLMGVWCFFSVWAAGAWRPASISTFSHLLMDVTHNLLLYNSGPGVRFLAARGRHASDRVSSRQGRAKEGFWDSQGSSTLMSHSETFYDVVCSTGVIMLPRQLLMTV